MATMGRAAFMQLQAQELAEKRRQARNADAELARRIQVVTAAKVLGVDVDASEEVIEVAFRVELRHAHPDVGGSDEICRRLIAARDVLREHAGRGAACTA